MAINRRMSAASWCCLCRLNCSGAERWSDHPWSLCRRRREKGMRGIPERIVRWLGDVVVGEVGMLFWEGGDEGGRRLGRCIVPGVRMSTLHSIRSSR